MRRNPGNPNKVKHDLAETAGILKGIDIWGQDIHFVQVGLGANSTFNQNASARYDEWSYQIERLIQTMSAHIPRGWKGLAIEPVPELAQLQNISIRWLPGVSLLQAAMGGTRESRGTLAAIDSEAVAAARGNTRQGELSRVEDILLKELTIHE